jgi:hypothetical protein
MDIVLSAAIPVPIAREKPPDISTLPPDKTHKAVVPRARNPVDSSGKTTLTILLKVRLN